MKENQIGLIIMQGAEELGHHVEDWLKQWLGVSREELLIEHSCPRFTTGEGKAQLCQSVRGRDIYIVSDVTNYECSFLMRDRVTYMSPDEHYMDIKRVISACGGKYSRLTVLMPYLYCGRQDKRNGRESLDAALMLQELTALGVDNIITVDAHNPCVENAVHNKGFDNIKPTYQMIKAVVRSGAIDMKNTVMVSPDEGAIKRNAAYARWLKIGLGLFYKIRDVDHISDGQNHILQHEYMGESVEGKCILMADDILATGNTLLSAAKYLKELGAVHTSFIISFPQFTGGLEAFDKAYEEGVIHKVFGTNLIYRIPELMKREWYVDVDISKYLAYVILAIYEETSIKRLMGPEKKIQQFLKSYYGD